MFGLGYVIKKRREARKLTLEQLHALTGVDKNTVSDLENGVTKNPRLGTIQKIATALGTTAGSILTAAEAFEARNGVLPYEGQNTAPLNTGEHLTFAVRDDASEELAAREPTTPERTDMTERNPQQRLLAFVNSLDDDDEFKTAHYAALKAVAARRGLHESDLPGAGET